MVKRCRDGPHARERVLATPSQPSADDTRIFRKPSAELCGEGSLLRNNLKAIHVRDKGRQ